MHGVDVNSVSFTAQMHSQLKLEVVALFHPLGYNTGFCPPISEWLWWPSRDCHGSSSI